MASLIFFLKASISHKVAEGEAALADSSHDFQMKEWETARGMLSDFDERLHDLRKLGFSFITALLTAEAILIPQSVAATADAAGVPDLIKLAVMGTTLLLIVATKLIERNYQLLQGSAAQRALVLERSLNLELTEVISDRFRKGRVKLYEFGVYFLLVSADFFLGAFLLYPNYAMISVLGAFSFLATGELIDLTFFSLHYGHGREDWTLEPLECKKGGSVRITVTNLEVEETFDPQGIDPRKVILFSPGDVAWQIIDKNGTAVYEEKILDQQLRVGPDESYTWVWRTQTSNDKLVDPSIYRIVPSMRSKERSGRQAWPRPLRRKIFVEKPEDASKKPEAQQAVD